MDKAALAEKLSGKGFDGAHSTFHLLFCGPDKGIQIASLHHCVLSTLSHPGCMGSAWW